MKETVAVIASLLAIAGNIPYVRDVVTRRVEPHAYTWFVWSIVSGVVFFGQLAKGAGVGALPTAASEIFTLIIFMFSLKYGFKHITRTDTFFLVAALLGLIPWVLTKDPTISVIVAVSIDVIAFMPTLRKTWEKPDTETPILYGANVIRHILALFSMQAYNIATTLHSIAMIIMNAMMTLVVVGYRKKN
ncbi:MAG: hypothetical protein G01um10148_516 [Parcubacteria group bacterium Gr01-1014_8]|nr:MAG: hypothetical protein G01um10148_516 [Parcubacteria group bacterium Gr01-1014_8]